MYPHIVLSETFAISSYSLLVTVAIIVAVVVAFFECRRYGIPLEYFPAGAFWTVLGGIVGGKVFDIVFFQWPAFLRHPWDTLTWGGGWMYYGAEIGGGIGLVSYLIVRRIDIYRPIDICGVVLLLAHAIGRMGCFLAGCCYGTETDSWIGVTFPGMSHPVHPTQLYEAVPLAVGFVVFWIYRRRFVIPGSVYAVYAVLYGLLRFAIEFYRDDAYPFGLLHLSPSQYIALAYVCLGAALFHIARTAYIRQHT